ncbi:mannose-1-phosphate guanylyltransferase [Parafilimonas sp.]|uniref:mannose-1-phosphate guanylyltransferase n=1 Tax=Parafilimonas sp. TaxID=1969739 RepID=UPI0039E5788B
MNKHNYVAILAGGLGTRFWPKSRASFPKQFLDILGTGETLIQSAYKRYASFILPENIYIITSEEYIGLVKQQLPQLSPDNILAEPSRKNTAPCVAYIAFKLFEKDPEAALVIAPSDHLVIDLNIFKTLSLHALEFAKKHNAFVTLGIKPTYPNTGYGYIQYDLNSLQDENVYEVKTFTEKPDLKLAQTFLESGDFLWNAGIFIWMAKDVIAAFEQFQPEMHELFLAEKDNFNRPEEKKALARIYPLCVSISIDYAIMEKTENVYVIPADFGWSDLGTWNSAYTNLEKDEKGNAITGEHVIAFDVTNTMVSSHDDKLLVLQGLEDFIVVDTKDVLLICKKDKEQQVKEFLSEVKKKKGDRYL